MNQMQPIYILPQNTQRSTGKSAQNANIQAAKELAQTVKTTLGPKGMDKMIVDEVGDITVTNDGVTILKQMRIDHPTAKMIVEIAKTQEESVGDGTTTVVILAGELLKQAEVLLEKGVHPTIITKGYRMAEQEARKKLTQVSIRITIGDEPELKQIAMTAMIGKSAEGHREFLADLVVLAAKQVYDDKSGINPDDVKIEKISGENIEKSSVLKGIVLNKERAHPSMPEMLEQARICLFSMPLEIRKAENTQVHINSAYELNSMLDREKEEISKFINTLIINEINIVLCEKNISDEAINALTEAGIIAIRRIKKSDMERISKATGAKIITSINQVSESTIGKNVTFKEEKIGKENYCFISNENPKSVSILIRGQTEHNASEYHRAVTDAFGDIIASLNDGYVVAGAGAPEMIAAIHLREYALAIDGKEQLAIMAYADALESIPLALAENSGHDAIAILNRLRTVHQQENCWHGVNVFDGIAQDAWQMGVIEPLKVKTQALNSATEVSELILRIDDVIIGHAKKKEEYQEPLPNFER